MKKYIISILDDILQNKFILYLLAYLIIILIIVKAIKRVRGEKI